jgi:hypothetical protein
MTQEITQDWHKNSISRPNELTVRLGERFSELCDWAANENLEDTLEICYTILGLDEITVGIPNLVDELSRPESKVILAKWNANPLVHELQLFAERFLSDEVISTNYTRLSHAGPARQNKQLFRDIVNRTFLLTLVTHPLAYHPDEVVSHSRRMLRIWLIIQAAERLLRNGYSADSVISDAARYLILDPGDDKWRLVDQLLQRTRHQLATQAPSYERFTSAIGGTAELLRQESDGKSARRFLNAITSIAQGLHSPVHERGRDTSHSRYFRKLNLSPPSSTSFQASGISFAIIQSHSSDDEDTDEDERTSFAYLVNVDPTDSEAQQTLSSGSVHIQTAELSHYLPWSWGRPLPPERNAIDSWISGTLVTLDGPDQLGAAIVWLAMRFSRSLALIQALTIEPEITEEWSLSPGFEQLKRRAPRRHSGWRPSETTRNDVAPFRDDLSFVLPPSVKSALSAPLLKSDLPPRTLGELWQQSSAIKLEAWFNQQAKAQFPRVKSGMLANARSQTLFNSTGDHNFTRLLTSHPNSALPGASSYATWDIRSIEKGLELSLQRKPGEPANTNVIGSLLTPLESVLALEIDRANLQVKQAAGKDLISYHNSLTQYVVMALYAATGARPLRDPFESALHFNLEHLSVYINDKNDGGLHNGRLVPLPAKAALMVSHYQKYLSQASTVIAEHRPELAAQMSALAQSLSAQIPFFFLIDHQLKWHPLADVNSLGVTLFQWSLPANLFRHRYAQHLLSLDVDAEIIEGWMGHAERSVATYSDYSARCWEDDANQSRDSINHLFESLPFQEQPSNAFLPELTCGQGRPTGYAEPRIFGQRARAYHRTQRVKAAIQEARNDIRIFLQNQKIEDLDKVELERLGNQMLLKENHLPHPHAALRFSVLTKTIERSEHRLKQGIRKRMISLGEERSLLSEDVAEAISLQSKLRQWADKTRKSLIKAQLSKTSALCVGAAILAIEKRLCYSRLLTDVTQGQHFRLIQRNKQYFLEYSETLEQQDFSAPVQRHEVSYKVASLLNSGTNLKKQIETGSTPAPRELKGLESLLLSSQAAPEKPTIDRLFQWLCNTINQANLIQLPGMVAGALSGRVTPTSPSLADYVRILEGKAVELPGLRLKQPTPEHPSEGLSQGRSQETDKLRLQQNAKEFVGDITQKLNTYTKANARAIANELEIICKSARGSVSKSILLLGYWIAETTRKGKGRPRAKLAPYAQNTLTTYFSSTSGVFQGLTYNVDLAALDDEEVTALCGDMLEFKRLRSVNTAYFSKRLKEFFRCATRFGVAAPDWDELDIDNESRQVSPGLITEPEYLKCIDQIQLNSGLTADHRLMLSFVLILSYRFGLRAREAIGLLRKDWCQNDDYQWVLVRNNPHRELKSKASRRAVPLLFALHPSEKVLIERTIARYRIISPNDPNKPILAEALVDGSVQLTTIASRIPEALIQTIRSVTRNPKMVLHHCRHSFYNRLAPALLGIETPLARHLSSDLNPQAVREIVLGETSHVSRRSGMALARLMGHRYPSTGLKNYNRVLTEWADSLTPVRHQRARKIAGVLDVLKLVSAPIKPTTPDVGPLLEFPQPSLAQILKTLRLVALGQSYSQAGGLTQLRPDCLPPLRNVIETATARMRFKSLENKNVWLKGTECPNALLESINDKGWRRLISHAESLSEPAGMSGSDTDWPNLQELPFLTGKNRHLLMDQRKHCLLAKHVIDLFGIPPGQYQVVARFDDESMSRMLRQSGLQISPEFSIAENGHKNRVYFDAFPTYIPERESEYQSLHYGGLIMKRSRYGVVHDSFELAVAFLATGVLRQLSAIASKDIV